MPYRIANAPPEPAGHFKTSATRHASRFCEVSAIGSRVLVIKRLRQKTIQVLPRDVKPAAGTHLHSHMTGA